MLILICADCDHEVKKDSELVGELIKGPEGQDDLRCPECACPSFTCGTCFNEATGIKRIDGKVTWNCKEGCNP